MSQPCTVALTHFMLLSDTNTTALVQSEAGASSNFASFDFSTLAHRGHRGLPRVEAVVVVVLVVVVVVVVVVVAAVVVLVVHLPNVCRDASKPFSVTTRQARWKAVSQADSSDAKVKMARAAGPVGAPRLPQSLAAGSPQHWRRSAVPPTLRTYVTPQYSPSLF